MKIRLIHIGYILIVVLITACTNDQNQQNKAVNSTQKSEQNQSNLFVKRSAKETNVYFKNTINDNIQSTYNALSFESIFNGGGVGVADLNNDGLQDIYFTGNMVKDKLYINKGNFKFEDISKSAGIESVGWSTGVSFVDINNDGYLDIYVSKAGPEKDPEVRENKLFINQKNQTFIESANEYGLADSRKSTQAAFFDFDKDGDKDCVVMNNTIFNSADIFGNDKKVKTDANYLNENSTTLYENVNGTFKDITKQAGIQKLSYGLGLIIQDFNEDQYPDIYIANDYYVPDYMFINNMDGTFTDKMKSATKQISFYSMGIDAADINNDGLTDFSVLDMSSNDHIRNKTLMPSMDVNLFYTLVAHFQYQPQFMFNAVQLNNGNQTYSNIAQMAGMANSEWSWSILWADLDLDGFQDCHITNGIKRYMNDNDFRRRIEILNVKARAGETVTSKEKINLYQSMPQLEINNVVYQNNGDLTFKDQSNQWALGETLNSNGAAYADLDNDGDLDIITNNLDQTASIFESKANNNNNFVCIDLPYEATNTKVKVYTENKIQSKEYHPVRGFQSSQDSRLYFGIGKNNQADSITIVWQDETQSSIKDVKANQFIKPSKSDAKSKIVNSNKSTLFKSVSPNNLGINFKHKENSYNDYDKEILLPYLQSTLGPKISVADVNNDGLDDFYIGGAKDQSGELNIQTSNGKFKVQPGPWSKHKKSEDMASEFFDADNDGDLDLYVCSGGNEFNQQDEALADRLYLNNGNLNFTISNILPKIKTVSSSIAAGDFDQDGDMDIFVGARQISQNYPLASASYFLVNNTNKYLHAEVNQLGLGDFGLVNDVIASDINNDYDLDLIIASEWNNISIIENVDGKWINKTKDWDLDKHKGWWQSICAVDLDNDGDKDLIAGNLGLNSKFKASNKKPLKLHAGDFDGNGTNDIVLGKLYKDKYVPVRGFECSSEQMPQLQQRFDSYAGFASADLQEILNFDKSVEELVLETNVFETVVFENVGNTFKQHKLPIEAQLHPALKVLTYDFDNDGFQDVLLFGNIYNMEPETPRLDAPIQSLLSNQGNFNFIPISTSQSGLHTSANVKDAVHLKVKNQNTFIIANNNQYVNIFQK